MAEIFQNITGQTINGVAPGGQIVVDKGGQSLSDQGFAYVGSSALSGTPQNPSLAGVSPSYSPPKLMSLGEAQKKADEAFSGMQSPMTLSQIRQRELEAQALGRQTAMSVYDPKIRQSEALGRGEVSTAQGILGQGSGFNLSTAEHTYINNIHNEVFNRTKELVDSKATLIMQGDFQAAERADEQIARLKEYDNQLVMAKADYALRLMADNKDAARLALEQQRFSFEREEAYWNRDLEMNKLELTVANLMGEYRGKPTLEAENAKIRFALDEAGLTGTYNGKETLDSRIKQAQLELQREGLDLDWAKFEESVRQFNQEMSLSWANYQKSIKQDEGVDDGLLMMIDSAADSIINAEKYGSSTDGLWWSMIDRLAEQSEVADKEALDRYLINAIRAKKGESLVTDWSAPDTRIADIDSVFNRVNPIDQYFELIGPGKTMMKHSDGTYSSVSNPSHRIEPIKL